MAHGRYLFVSDLHLDPLAPPAIAQFVAFLREQAVRSDGLYILGDLFETWIGDDDDEPARREVCVALRELVRGGVPCHVQHGNRDFLLGERFAAFTGCMLLPDPVVLEAGSIRAVLSHGDLLCTGDVRYQRFRSLVRAPGFQAGYLGLPVSTRRAVARIARAGSRRHVRQMREEIMDVEDAAVSAMLRVAGADLLIHGHTHRPGVHRLTVEGRPCTRIVLGDWYEQGSCLTLHADGRHVLDGLPRQAASGTPE